MTDIHNSGASCKRALIVRSAPSWLFEKALRHLKDGHPDVTVDVYAPKTVAPSLRDREDIGEVFDDNWDGFYRKEYITPALTGKLQSKNYDHIVILYNDNWGEDYGPLRRLVFKIKPATGRVSSFNINQLWSGLSSEGIIGRYLLPRKWAYNVMVMVFALEIIVTTIIDRTAFTIRKFRDKSVPIPQRKQPKVRKSQ